MNVIKALTTNYENIPPHSRPENKPKANPTCRGVALVSPQPRATADGEAGSNPILSPNCESRAIRIKPNFIA